MIGPSERFKVQCSRFKVRFKQIPPFIPLCQRGTEGDFALEAVSCQMGRFKVDSPVPSSGFGGGDFEPGTLNFEPLWKSEGE